MGRRRRLQWAWMAGALGVASGCTLIATFDPEARRRDGSTREGGSGLDGALADADQDSESSRDGGLSSDGGGVPALTFCDGVDAATFCADFDRGPDAAAGWSGVNQTRGMISVDTAAKTKPNALAASTQVADLDLAAATVQRSFGVTATHVRIELDVNFEKLERLGDKYASVVRLYVDGPAGRQLLRLDVRRDSPLLVEATPIDGGISYVGHGLTLPFQAGRWYHLAVDWRHNGSSAIASIAVDDVTILPPRTLFGGWNPGLPMVEIGVVPLGTPDTLRWLFDDVVVRVE